MFALFQQGVGLPVACFIPMVLAAICPMILVYVMVTERVNPSLTHFIRRKSVRKVSENQIIVGLMTMYTARNMAMHMARNSWQCTWIPEKCKGRFYIGPEIRGALKPESGRSLPGCDMSPRYQVQSLHVEVSSYCCWDRQVKMSGFQSMVEIWTSSLPIVYCQQNIPYRIILRHIITIVYFVAMLVYQTETFVN